MKLRYLIFILFVIYSPFVCSQTLPVSESEVRAELEKRGISEEELIAEMRVQGLQIEDLNNPTPEQLVQLEQIINTLESRSSGTANESSGQSETESVNKEAFLEVPTTEESAKLTEEINEIIEESVGEVEEVDTRIYGHSFFRNRELSVFETSTDVKAPETYILGAGDKIVISIYGISREELAHEINADGYIEVNNRRIFLKGISLGSAREKLFSTLSRFYRFERGEFEVSLSYSRTININIQGEVNIPGGYTLSAINNAFNGLVAAGGPSSIGSLRDIVLIKKNGNIENLDFYSFLKDPTAITNAFLEQGDVIVVPVARKIVTIKGAVRRAMRYEMKDGEGLAELLSLAGGYTRDANRNLVQVIRFTSEGRKYIDIQTADIPNFDLVDGDEIIIRKVENELDNFVQISGAVINTGAYENTVDLDLGKLIELAELKKGARKDLAFIRRMTPDERVVYIRVNIEESSSDLSLKLQDKDNIIVYASSLFTDNGTFNVNGAVRNGGAFEIAIGQEISIKNAIELAGGLARDASEIAIIETQDPLNPKKKEYQRLDLSDALTDTINYTLTALQSLQIFSESLFDERSEVIVSGAVNSPGSFQYGINMTIGDALTLSGGFRLGASTNRVEVSRLVLVDNEPTKVIVANLDIDRDLAQGSTNLDFLLNPYDEIMVRYVPEFELQQIVLIEGEVKFPGQYSLIKNNETIKDLVSRAGGVTEEAFLSGAKLIRSENDLGPVVVKLKDVLENRNSNYNFRLRRGDRIMIPKVSDFVSIQGATNANVYYNDDILADDGTLNVPFEPSKNAKYYIEEYAGGVSENGSSAKIFVEYPSGEVKRTKNYLIFKVYPKVEVGSLIRVGAKPEKTEEQREREDIDWSKVLADAVGQAVSILSLLLLVQRL